MASERASGWRGPASRSPASREPAGRARAVAAALLLAGVPFLGCGSGEGAGGPAGPAARYGYRVVHRFAHDPTAYTQGLLFDGGFLYEGTGRYGHSDIRRVDLESGSVLASRPLDRRYFGEGLTLFRGRFYQLTWKAGVAFVYEKEGFRRVREHRYRGEGWGLTNDGEHLIMSDGTPELRFLDPESFREIRRVTVREEGRPVPNLNELEYVRGEIFANVWQTDFIVRISPGDGRVVGRIDLAGLLAPEDRTPGTEVLNGIAYDAATNRLFVTGKYWSRLYEIEPVAKQ